MLRSSGHPALGGGGGEWDVPRDPPPTQTHTAGYSHTDRIACPRCPKTSCHSLIKDSWQDEKFWVRERSDLTDVKGLFPNSLSHFIR